MDDIFSPHKGGVQTPSTLNGTSLTESILLNRKALPTSTTLNKSSNSMDIFSPHHGGVYTPLKNTPTTITINEKELPVSSTLNGKALNSNNLENTDKPKTNTNIPILLIGGLIIVFLVMKK